VIGMTFAHSYGAMLASAAVLGFFMLGVAGPIGFQYGAEVGYPAPESLTQGLVLLAGQISGIFFVVGMNVIGMQRGMIAFIVMCVVNIVLTLFVRESPAAQSL
jgi:hypothetical protein